MALKNKEYVQLIKAWDKTTGLPKIGDAANITVNLIQNGTRAAASGTVEEVDSTNCPGDYKITITAAERNYDSFGINVKSSTANILCRTSGELTADIALSTGTKGLDNTFDKADAALTSANAASRPGDEMDLVGAPNATAITAIQLGLASSADIVKLVGLTGGKVIKNAAGTEVKKYDSAGNLVVTLTRTGSGPWTWTPVWA